MISIIAFVLLILWYRYRISHDKPVNRKIFRALMIVECLGLVVTVGMMIYRRTRVAPVNEEEQIRDSIIKEIEVSQGTEESKNAEASQETEESKNAEASQEKEKSVSEEGIAGYDSTEDADRLTLLYAAMEEIQETFLGNNVSMDSITEDVVLKDSYQNGAVEAVWYVGESGLIDENGRIYRSSLTEPQEVSVIVYLNLQSVKYPYSFSFTVLPQN